jgi:hypothetical protein
MALTISKSTAMGRGFSRKYADQASGQKPHPVILISTEKNTTTGTGYNGRVSMSIQE